MSSFKLDLFILIIAANLGFLGSSAYAVQVRCPIVHRTEIMSEIHRLESAQKAWELTPGSMNSLKLSLWKRMLTSGSVKNFDERVYNGHLLSLLMGEAKPADVNVLRYTEGRLAALEYLNIESGKLLTPESFLKDIESSGARRQRAAAKLLKKMDLQNGVTRRFLNDFSAEFFLASRGFPEKSTDFILKNSEERVRDTWAKIFQEQLLERGLRRIADQLPENNLTKREILTIKLKVFLKHKLFALLTSLPSSLPAMKDTLLSEDLMVKVMLDGMSAHRAQIEKELGSQGKASNYNRLRRLWTPLFAGALMYVTFPHVYVQMHESVQKEVEVEIAAQREKARLDFRKGVDDIAASTRYVQIANIQQRTNRYLTTVELLTQKWEHRNWTYAEVLRVTEKSYGELITPEVRTNFLNSLPVTMSERDVFTLAQKIEHQIFISQNLMLPGGNLP